MSSISLFYDEDFAEFLVKKKFDNKVMKIFSGFSHIGHIIHVNLRENLLPYKNVIGQILLDKIASCRFLLFISCFIAKLKCSSATADEGEIVFRIFFYIYILKCRK